jgi:hypothetical protein
LEKELREKREREREAVRKDVPGIDGSGERERIGKNP